MDAIHATRNANLSAILQRIYIPFPRCRRPGKGIGAFHCASPYWICVDIAQCFGHIIDATKMKSCLPDLRQTKIECHTRFEAVHHSGNRSGRRNFDKQMAVIRHDDEPKEKEWMDGLHPIETFNGLPRMSWIRKKRYALPRHRGDQHRSVVLDGMTLSHSKAS